MPYVLIAPDIEASGEIESQAHRPGEQRSDETVHRRLTLENVGRRERYQDKTSHRNVGGKDAKQPEATRYGHRPLPKHEKAECCDAKKKCGWESRERPSERARTKGQQRRGRNRNHKKQTGPEQPLDPSQG